MILFLFMIAAAQETAPISALEVKYRKQIFKDARFSAYLLQIPPQHASAMHRHDTDMLTLFVSGGDTKSTIYGKNPVADHFAVGEVRFRPAGFTHSTENIGANMFRAVILEFTSSVGTVQPTKPPNSRYWLIAVSDYKLSYQPKGKTENVLKRKSGEVEYFAGGSARQWTNAPSVPARIIAVVFR